MHTDLSHLHCDVLVQLLGKPRVQCLEEPTQPVKGQAGLLGVVSRGQTKIARLDDDILFAWCCGLIVDTCHRIMGSMDDSNVQWICHDVRRIYIVCTYMLIY